MSLACLAVLCSEATGASAPSLFGAAGGDLTELVQSKAVPVPLVPNAGRSLEPETKRDILLQPKAALRVTPARGFYDAPVRVTLSTELESGRLFYTTNGAVPAPGSGQLYREPLLLAGTTVLRIAAVKEGDAPLALETHTYIFPRQVLRQTGAGFPKSWGVNGGAPVPPDYEMDPEVVDDPAYAKEIEDGLKSIPSFSLVMDPQDLFGAERGIYAHPKESGELWERPASCELIYPDGRPGFQIGCGVRVQGGWNRRPEESPKHAFRLIFRKKYGAGKMKAPLFQRRGAEEFDELILRAGCNNSWLHWSGEERARADYVRDQWMRESHAAMGHPSARGCFVHLYLNGLYWGLYNLTERPDEHFAAEHFGGSAKDYDARNGSHVLSGDEVKQCGHELSPDQIACAAKQNQVKAHVALSPACN